MKKLLLISLFPFTMYGQSFKIKKEVVPASLMLLSGMAEGVQDYLQFHYDGNNQFWQPDISWTNKYKHHDPAQGERFPGSTTIFVFTTDGWHLMKATNHLFLFSSIALKIGAEKRKWYVYILEGISYWVVNRIGFGISYNLLKH
jgi:hypothetical protein